MNELAEVGIGGFIGSGNLDISIPGEENSVAILCNWGPNIGFYLYAISIILIMVILVFNVKKIFKMKN